MYSCPEVKTNFVRKRFKRPMKAKNQNKTKIPQMYRLTFHQTLLRYSDREIEFSVFYSSIIINHEHIVWSACGITTQQCNQWISITTSACPMHCENLKRATTRLLQTTLECFLQLRLTCFYLNIFGWGRKLICNMTDRNQSQYHQIAEKQPKTDGLDIS